MEKIMDALVSDGRFETLVQALQTGGLDVLLRMDEEYTVFAPTDEAFSELPDGTLEILLEDKDRLDEVLKYHIAKGTFMADDLAEMTNVQTEEGGTLPISVSEDGTLLVNHAEIVKEDIEGANGVIQAIDMVMIPDIATS